MNDVRVSLDDPNPFDAGLVERVEEFVQPSDRDSCKVIVAPANRVWKLCWRSFKVA